MITIISDFEKRVTEVEIYFSYIEKIDEKDALLYFPYNKTHKFSNHKPELLKVLKANIFLMLYNMAEASIKQSLSEIYDQITSDELNYKDVINEVKHIWIDEKYKNFKNTGTKRIFNIMNNIAEDIIDIKFNSEKTISGNIDGRKIRDFSVKFGFSSKVHVRANNGEKLHLVKTQRNNLAHGVISFAECGRNYSISDLKQIKHEVIIFLRRILKNIEKYLVEQKYIIE